MKLLLFLYYFICMFLYLLLYVIMKNCLYYLVWFEIKLVFKEDLLLIMDLLGDLYDKGILFKVFYLSNYFF